MSLPHPNDMHSHTHACTHARTHAHTHTHTRMHPHTHAHTHTHTPHTLRIMFFFCSSVKEDLEGVTLE